MIKFKGLPFKPLEPQTVKQNCAIREGRSKKIDKRIASTFNST